jgi:hypothetical protein
MKSKATGKLTKNRRRQRAHAKKRFLQRFALDMNRDRIHEIETKIASGQVVCLGDKHPGLRNYLVEVEGRLVAVGYSRPTHRVVTALPDDYLRKVPPETISRARLKLLDAEQQRVISLIKDGSAELLHETGSRGYYKVNYEGLTVRVGYDSEADRLVLYSKPAKGQRPTAPGLRREFITHAARFGVLELDAAVGESYRAQIRERSARFLWRFSNTLTFQEVQWQGERRRVGYGGHRQLFYEYQDPPEEMVELRSSLRLLAQPLSVIEAVTELVRQGSAELLGEWNDRCRLYRAVHDGETYYFAYSTSRNRIEAWPPPRRADENPAQDTPESQSVASEELSLSAGPSLSTGIGDHLGSSHASQSE